MNSGTTSQPAEDLCIWGAEVSSHQLTVKAAALLSSATADETSAFSRLSSPESPLQLVRTVVSVENKIIGNERVINMCLLTSFSAFVH